MRSCLIDRHLLLTDPERFASFTATARETLNHLSSYYPGFADWYDHKVIPGLRAGERTILIRVIGGRLTGIAIVKDTPAERKLCCLRVIPQLQGSGLGLKLFDDAFAILGTEKPLLSVANEQLPRFNRIFRHFGFENTNRYVGLYRPQGIEHSFNGHLVPNEFENPSAREPASWSIHSRAF